MINFSFRVIGEEDTNITEILGYLDGTARIGAILSRWLNSQTLVALHLYYTISIHFI
jgi:hypothetical protein